MRLNSTNCDPARGKNIPWTSCTQGWLLREEVQLGMRDLVPTAISPKTILRRIIDKGYYIWPVWIASSEEPRAAKR